MLVSEKMDGVEGEFEVENADNLEDKVDGTVVAERTKKKKKKKKPNGTYLFRWRRYADDLKLYLRIVDVCDIDSARTKCFHRLGEYVATVCLPKQMLCPQCR